ncbi:kinase-like domain-containing protein [Mycena rosella]|uniref:Kinase-like domain-containing protein n=1 Tax=Mycena rosella TaxID=1033263 RepID=A0AAD7GIY8_MYCRO|nr:kinase-like domain-containing protein [Mycena rosella]
MDAALGLAGVVPVPGLDSVFRLFSFIVVGVPEVQASRKQIKALASTTGRLLATLNAEFLAKRLIEENCRKQLEDLRSLLEDIHQFTDKETRKRFFKALLQKDSRISDIENFYRRIGVIINEFQITSLLNVQSMLKNDEVARIEDAESLAARLDSLERNQLDLKEALAMMVSIQRRLETQPVLTSNPEQQFYAHALEYLTSTTGKRVEAEDWMIPAFEVDYGAEIGSGGFGTVYRGTWNRTEVAIKCVHNFGGMKPNVSVWLNLRHPNILQFLGANTLDDKPFIMMPYLPYNARQFLQRHTEFDPLYIICHGDLKGINVLVDDLGRALLCDFGLTRIKADITSRTAQIGTTITSGSRNWMAPEMFAGSPARLPSDMYAFGMTVYELYTDEIPLSSVAFTDFVEVVLRMDVRPERPDPEECPRLADSLWDLAESCWTKNPKERPTARQAHDMIAHLIQDMTRHAQPRAHSMPTVALKAGDSMGSSSAHSNTGLQRSISAGAPDTSWHSRESSSPPSSMPPQPLPYSRSASEGSTPSYSREALANTSGSGRDTRVLRMRTKILGPDHPDTLLAMHNLAVIYYAVGKAQDTIQLTMEVVERENEVLGSGHPYTRRSTRLLEKAFQTLA